jgi:hypothetical protein
VNRTLRIAANLVLPAMFAAAVAIPAMTYAAPEAGWSGNEVQRDMATSARPDATPTWDREAAEAFPRCEGTREGVFYPVVVVVTMGGDLARMSFDEAWGRGESVERADDVWVVGGCPR